MDEDQETVDLAHDIAELLADKDLVMVLAASGMVFFSACRQNNLSKLATVNFVHKFWATFARTFGSPPFMSELLPKDPNLKG